MSRKLIEAKSKGNAKLQKYCNILLKSIEESLPSINNKLKQIKSLDVAGENTEVDVGDIDDAITKFNNFVGYIMSLKV